jgi:acyl carrier protein
VAKLLLLNVHLKTLINKLKFYMLSNNNVISLIQKSLDGLYEASMIDEKVVVSNDTPLFGSGSNIDSMCFVALMTDVEDKLCGSTGKDIFVVLSDIEELYPAAPILTAGMLASFLVNLAND